MCARPALRLVLAWAIGISLVAPAVSAQTGGAAQGSAPPPAQQDSGQLPPAEPGSAPPRPAGVGTAAPPVPEATQPEADAPEAERAAPAQDTGSQTSVLSSRPFSGLFGGAAPGGSRKHRLDLSGSLFGVYLRGDAVPGPTGTSDLLDDGRSTFAGGSTSLSYGRDWTHASIGADGTASLAYIPDYADGGDPWVDRWSVSGNGGFNRALGRKTTVSAAGQLMYTPYYQQDLFLTGGVPTVSAVQPGTPGLDFVVARDPFVGLNARGAVSYAFNRRASLETYFERNDRTFVSTDTPDLSDQRVGARYLYRFSRYVGLRAGYAYRSATYGQQSRRRNSHDLDVGLDGGYGHSFALSRRTTFSFNTGSSIFVRDEVQQGADGQAFDPKTRLFINGSADLVHGWARTWSTNLGYRRGVDYEVGFDQPLLTDSALAGIGGLLTRRVDFSAQAAYTRGNVGFSGADRGFATSSAQASLRGAITKNLAAYAQYFYYHYNFGSGVVLPGFLQSAVDRQGVSVGLTAWLPLVKRSGSRGGP